MFNWFEIADYQEILDMEEPCLEFEADFEGIGLKKIQINRGYGVCVTYDGVMLMLNLNNRNPFSFDGLSIWLNNGKIILGIEDEE